jgi:predicted phage tail protein
MDTTDSVILNNVEVQANGIIRNEKGRYIGMLINDVEYEGEHIKGVKVDMPDFKKDLVQIINKHSVESGSNTPDFLLAEYLIDCLKAYKKIHDANEKWYGKKLEITLNT